jgi:hypothetical protein
MGGLSPLDQRALPISNAITDRVLGFRQDPAVEEGRLGFQGTGSLSGSLAGMLLQAGFGPLFGPAVKKLAGVTPDVRLGFQTLEEIDRLNAARGTVLPGDVEGGQQLTFAAVDELVASQPALAAQFGAGGGLPQLPQQQQVAFGGPSSPVSDDGADEASLTQGGLGGTTRALQELQRQRLVRTLIDRLDEQSIGLEA